MSSSQLARLRDIGWSKWDPIGILQEGQNWRDEDCLPFAAEYDSYLLQAVGMLRKGIAKEDVARYLDDIAANHMGLGHAPGATSRATEVAAAIQADEHLWPPTAP